MFASVKTMQAHFTSEQSMLPIRRSLRAVLREVDPASPWIAYCVGDHEPLTVFETKRGKVRVGFGPAGSREKWITVDALIEILGIPNVGAEVDWQIPIPTAPLESLRFKETPYQRLRAMLAGERSTLWVAIIYSVVIGLLSLVVPVAVQSLVNTVAFGSVLQPIVVLTGFVFIALGFSTVLNGLRYYVIELLQRSIFARVSQDFTHRLLRVEAKGFDKHHGPEVVNRFFDVVTVQKAASTLLIDGLTITMQTVIGMILVALYHPLLLAFDVLLVVAMLFIIFVLGRGAIYTAIKESKAKYAMEAWLEQIAAHLIAFKSPSGAAFAAEHSRHLLEHYLDYRKKHFSILLRQTVGSFALQAIASSILLGIGGYLVIDRQLTLGQLVAAELIVTLMVSGFTKFGKHLETYYDLLAGLDKLGNVVDLPLEREGGEAHITGGDPLKIHFRQMRYKNLSIGDFQVASGERLGLMGHNGSGKSTLADLLYGLREPESGVVTINNVDMRDLPLAELRSHVSLVRDVEIFPGTLLDNLRMGQPLSHDEARQLLERVGLLDEVQLLPNGMNTELHPSGRPLSRVQASRLMIARAIASRPRLLILDDALDQIDRIQEREEVCKVLFDPAAPWTLICVTERPDLLSRCNRLAVLEDGDLRDSNLLEVHA
jgi:putative ABC transport system ATP-binding protein